jgi:hypothetical protein
MFDTESGGKFGLQPILAIDVDKLHVQLVSQCMVDCAVSDTCEDELLRANTSAGHTLPVMPKNFALDSQEVLFSCPLVSSAVVGVYDLSVARLGSESSKDTEVRTLHRAQLQRALSNLAADRKSSCDKWRQHYSRHFKEGDNGKASKLKAEAAVPAARWSELLSAHSTRMAALLQQQQQQQPPQPSQPSQTATKRKRDSKQST